MKTYKQTTEEPRLVIDHDEGAPSPRDNGNLGLFFTKASRYESPDGTAHPLYRIMVETGDEAEDLAHHIKLIEERAHAAFKESAPKDGNSHDEDLHIIDEIHPVYRYEHGNVIYRRGVGSGFDYSNCGFYIVTAQGASGKTWTPESIAAHIDAELEEYSKWANGEVFRITLYDEDGNEKDTCGGFYSLEDIRSYLPEEWRDERLEDYI